MPWIVGVDEAGYGPNLGPFVMAAVACRVPADAHDADLWQLLKNVVRRKKDREDGRLWIDDSKVVHGGKRGLKALERGVLAALGPPVAESTAPALQLSHWLEHIFSAALAEVQAECWYAGSTPLPTAVDADDLRHSRERFHSACNQARLCWARARGVIVCPARFNALLDRWESKSLLLMLSLAELLGPYCQAEGDTEAVFLVADKHGGRDNYAAVLQQAIPGGTVVAGAQARDGSSYEVKGLARPLHITFRPRADQEYFCVALASMLAKYTREMLMLEFNQFWRQHLPTLPPTAGYPVDALRFMTAIRPVAERLHIPESQLWRRK